MESEFVTKEKAEWLVSNGMNLWENSNELMPVIKKGEIDVQAD